MRPVKEQVMAQTDSPAIAGDSPAGIPGNVARSIYILIQFDFFFLICSRVHFAFAHFSHGLVVPARSVAVGVVPVMTDT